MERNVARLFRERVALFGAVHFTQASMLAGAPPALPMQVGTSPHACTSACASTARMVTAHPRYIRGTLHRTWNASVTLGQ